MISGARGTPGGFNPLVPGDDDGTVALESTRLPGARDFLTVRAMHSFMMREQDVIDATVRFLKTGALRETGETEPVPMAETPPPAGEITNESDQTAATATPGVERP